MATRIKTVEVKAGDFLRVHIFPVRNYHKGKRTKRFMPSSAAQEKYNRKRAAMKFADWLHQNFTENDFAMRLSYHGVDVDLETAVRCFKNYLRRLKRAYAAAGVELKAMWKTEQGKNASRVHHHLVVNACPGVTDDLQRMNRIWNNGGFAGASFAYVAPLQFGVDDEGDFADGGLTGLSKYFVFDNREDAPKLTAQLYGHTRNLAEPEVRERIGEISVKEAGYINETRDASLLEGLYEGYTVCSVVPEVYDEDSENARFCTGLFGVVYLRRKEMRFNCVGKRRFGR